MRKSLLAIALATAVMPLAVASPATAQTRADQYRWEQAQRRFENERAIFDQERALSAQDEVYRGEDGRYYCRRSDGTTGLVIGAGVGALTGRAIDGGRNRATGTIVGGVLGALVGREVERSQDLRCR